MAEAYGLNDLQRANFRLCRLCTWPNYRGFGFNLENTTPPPHIIRTVESNSPAAAAGLKILDVILAVNNDDVSAADYRTTTQAITNARDGNNRLELLVIERRFYVPFKTKGMVFNPALARVIDAPIAMPREYTDFPKYTPRTCEIRLQKSDQSFGFEVVNNARDIGVSIQEVVPDSPAGRTTTLRKCDRVLEIDGKFVDNEPSRAIFERLTKAKKKRAVKLYVVDTNTYRHFQETRIPLPSKEFRNSSFARQYRPEPTSTYINVEDVPDEPRMVDVDQSRPTFPTPVLTYNPQSDLTDSSSTHDSHQDDIRLCTVVRTNATDQYGIELNYHRRDHYHSLKLTPGRLNTPSNAAQAGVKTDDHLIEINGENIEDTSDEQVKQRIRAIRYPEPLQILVADETTYNHYKQQNKVINSRLPSVRKLPENPINQAVSFAPSSPDSSVPGTIASRSLATEKPSPSLARPAIDSFEQPRISAVSSTANRQQYQLYRLPGSTNYGFSVNSNQGSPAIHKITQILPNSPAAQQGLRVGDHILSVNNQDATRMNAADFTQFLRTSAQNADARGQPLILEVAHDDSYQPPPAVDSSSPRPGPTDVPSPSEQTVERTRGQSPSYRPPSRKESRTSISTQPKASRNGSQRSPQTQPITSGDEQRRSMSTRPIVSRNGSKNSSAMQSAPYQNGTSKLTSNQQNSTRPYTNGYGSPQHNRYSQQETRLYETISPASVSRSRENLTRGAVDVVSKSRLLRYCRLISGPSQSFGFQLKPGDHKHIVHNIQPESPAFQAGLEENDCLIEVDDENVEGKSSREVAILIRNAACNGRLRVLIAPSSVKVLSRRSAKSLTSLNDAGYYRSSALRSNHNDQDSSSTNPYQSIPRIHGERNYRDRPNIANHSNHHLSEPSEPLPRKCVLVRDSSFRGCGFRLTEKEEYDTPIIMEVSPNSPAKRSGLAEGDHIIYIDSQNVQNFGSFNDIIHSIQRSFEENGQVTLITLTGPGYQVLRRRGGYLESTAFDYQAAHADQLKPRLCKLKLYTHEYDFGFTLQQNEHLSVKNVEPDSSADTYGLRRDDIILEVNGKVTKYLPIDHIKQMIETSKQERKLDLLVIDPDGYRFSTRHAIPLNSLLAFVQLGDARGATTTSRRLSQQPVYL